MFRILLCFLLLVTECVCAQDTLYPVLHYDPVAGLPAPVLYNIRTDKKGFIWLASRSGLFRFDGKNFYRYTTQEGLCDNEIIEIFPDSKNNIWCAGANGNISLLRDGIIDTTHSAIRNWHNKGMIFDIAEDRNGHIYFSGEEKTLYCLAPNGQLTEQNPPRIGSITTMGSHNGEIWLYGSGIILSYNRQRGFTRIYTPQLARQRDAVIAGEQAGSMWCLTQDGILCNLSDSSYVDLRICSKKISNLQITKSFLLISLYGSEFILYDLKYKKKYYLHLPVQTRIADMTEDGVGHLWISTLNKGLFAFTHEQTNKREIPFLLHGNFIAACASGNNILAVANEGVIKKHTYGSAQELYVKDPAPKQTNWTEYARFRKTICGQVLMTNEGIFCIEKDSAVLINKYGGKDMQVYQDSILILRHHNAVTKVTLPSDTGYQKLFSGRVSAIYLSGDTLWAASKDGLCIFNLKTGTLRKSIFTVPGNGRIEDICPWDGNGVLLATNNNGILAWKNGSILYNALSNNGLLDNDCRAVEICNSGWLIKHEMGLSFISKKGNIRTVSVLNGSPFPIINHIAAYGDHLLLATSQGIIQTDLTQLFNETAEGREVAIMRIRAMGFMLPTDTITLPPSNNKLQIEFAIPEYDHPELVMYAWQLNDGIWNTTYNKTLELADLRPNKYILRLKAKAPGYAWTQIKTIQFLVATPLWQTPVFIGCVGIGAVMVSLFLLRHYYKKQLAHQRHEASVKHQLLSLEQKALNAMMNPHFIFNAMTSIQSLLNKGDTDKANHYLVKFSRLIRSTLEVAQHESCLLEDELRRLTIYLQLERMRLDGRMDYVIDVDKNLPKETIHIPSLVLQTYVENAVIHGIGTTGQNGLIQIRFKLDDKTLQVIIQDNGMGFDTKHVSHKKNTRFGMAATEKRLELLSRITKKDYRVQIESPLNKDGGTCVLLQFPIITTL